MRALTIDEHGSLDRVMCRDDLDEPIVAQSGDVRVRVRAGSLNHLDLFVVAGMPGFTIHAPWILGSDAVGVVDQVGETVTSVSPGTRVVVIGRINDVMLYRELVRRGVSDYVLAPVGAIDVDARSATVVVLTAAVAALRPDRLPGRVGHDHRVDAVGLAGTAIVLNR